MPPVAAVPANRPAGQTARNGQDRSLQTCRKYQTITGLCGGKNQPPRRGGACPAHGFAAMAILRVLRFTRNPPLHTKTGRIAPNSARFLPKTGQKVHNRQASAERRKSVKKFCKNAKKHLQFARCRVIIFLGCERLVQIVTSVLRKPRYALMREVACAAWRRVFPRSMSDLRTGRKNYGNKGIRTLLHSAARTNVRFYFVMFLSGRTVQTRFTGFCHG